MDYVLSKKNYIGESKRNMATTWGEHNKPNHVLEPTKDLNKKIQHSYK